MTRRQSGLLLHVTSLPSPFGIGDLGPGAHAFVDYLARAGQTLWQVLPLVPPGYGHSPYASPSTFAADELLVSPERLIEDGLLSSGDLAGAPDFPAERVAFGAVETYKRALLDLAYARWRDGDAAHLSEDYIRFCNEHVDWLDRYALFAALKVAHGGVEWIEWPAPLARREESALIEAAHEHAGAMDRVRFGQFMFWRQWEALHDYARTRGVRILGDLPIYVAFDSADVWAHQGMFRLDASGRPTHVAGVPPDYFSETGQRWGNPLYRWDDMEADGFSWWRRRFAHTASLVDLVRLDHFRGLEAYWSVPASEPTAITGEWEKAPGEALIRALEAESGSPLPMVAEDLGIITPEVTALMDRFSLAGMAVLQFAFGSGAANSFLPHTYRPRLAAYTGTHDNNTFQGWWNEEATPEEREHARAYLHLDHCTDSPARAAVRAVMGSVAGTVVTPMQDVLGLGAETRMNTPGTVSDENWAWRVREDQFTDESAAWLRSLTELYNRGPLAPEAR
ncbi:4-alpha-glucanotransferase [Rubricoccus marinus]|uniref:4-alpha-glucanotransferase n=1 Tax=Rubricoccus marinus TaxID=716817 RepID=A0A259U0W6_9BACT|nr:4-alpha-glucanotransferase [Rubricoccus marinus]OZC03464.1 4-alpha-glucanotransferase [Rubricoccus marinus]